MYKLIKNGLTGSVDTVHRLSDNSSIPFNPANTDYQQFKQTIHDDTAQLEDATGVLLSPDEAKAFVATLP